DGAQFGFPVFPLDWKSSDDQIIGFKEFGFLPESVLNFLALLGWNPGIEQEIFSVSEMINLFSLDQIGKSGARFDFDKAKWFNAQYIQNSDPEYVKIHILEEFNNHHLNISKEQCNSIYSLYKDRVQLLTEFYTQGKYLVSDIFEISNDFIHKKWKSEWVSLYSSLVEVLRSVEWNKESLEIVLKQFMEKENLKMGEVLPSLRVMLSGTPMGPDIYLMLLALGQPKVIERINSFLVYLNKK
ncbi:MAG: glutamate--tRNA ligase, partial [Saprospiraceae bacterium]